MKQVCCSCLLLPTHARSTHTPLLEEEGGRADSTLVSKQVSSRGKAASHAPTDRLPRDNAVRFSTPRLYHIICFLNCVEPHHPAHVLAYAVNDQGHQHFSLFPTFVLLRITLALYRQIIPCSRRYLRGEGGEEWGKERRTLEISDLISMGFYSAKTLVFPSLDKLHFIAFCILVLVKETNECT